MVEAQNTQISEVIVENTVQEEEDSSEALITVRS